MTRTRRATALLIGAVCLVAVLVPASSGAEPSGRSHEFADVPDSHPFHDEIAWLADGDYASGYADGLFHPGSSVSRQAAVQMLWKMSGSPAGPYPDETYTDVGPTHPFLPAIEWAAAVDVMHGYADGTFRSTAPVSRQALGAILHRLSGIEGYYWPKPFSDVPSGHPFAEDIWWWVASGQADGYSDGTFRPTMAVTRQAAASFLQRYYAMLGGHWPYHAHTHSVCDEGTVTDEQHAAAEALIADTDEAIAANWPDGLSDAAADGFTLVGPILGGFGGHYVNAEYQSDGIIVDPTKPEVLMILGNGTIVGEMFTMEEVGAQGEQVGGCLTQWHAHEDICFTAPFFEGGDFVGLADSGGCPGSSMVFITPQMLHVFIDGRADPFEGIET